MSILPWIDCRGMALNKLRVFNMTQYKKVLWMDGDTLVLKVCGCVTAQLYTISFVFQ